MKRLDVASAATALKGLYPDCAKEDVKKFAEILSGCDEKTANIVVRSCNKYSKQTEKRKKVLSVEEKRKLAIRKCIGLIVALAVVSVLIATIEVAIIPTGSMAPTISPPSIVTGIRTNGHEINRFDVVCIKMSDSQALQTSVNPELPLCKRVIALGGEKVEIKDGKIFINDSPTPLDEPYLPADYVPNGNFGPFYVPEGQLFLMGDNRDNSYDSRYLDDHFFNQKDVTSVVFLVADKTGIDKI